MELAISPDGRWAATAGWDSSPNRGLVRVWDVATGKLRAKLPFGSSSVAFSPDGKWLGVGGESRCQFFKTGVWTPGAEIDHGADAGAIRMAFHPGSRIAALKDVRRSAARLVDVSTGRAVASLEAPNDSSIHDLVFSPDGRYLAISHTDQKVDVWDLSSIRRSLEELNLATGVPDIFGRPTLSDSVPVIDHIEVQGVDAHGLNLLAVQQTLREAGFAFLGLLDGGVSDAEELHVRGQRWDRLGHWQLAVADYRASVAREPNFDPSANDLAWCLASTPGRGHADEAIRWAQRALELEPGDINIRNTLGAALYRGGRFAEAAALLELNIAANSALVGYDWVFLAMCKERLGLRAEARLALNQATRWGSENAGAFANQVVPLHVLLQEAHAVLSGSFPDLPSNVFDR
jgi:hypothetical protein